MSRDTLMQKIEERANQLKEYVEQAPDSRAEKVYPVYLSYEEIRELKNYLIEDPRMF